MTFVKESAKNQNVIVIPRGCNCGNAYNPKLAKHSFTVDQKTCSSPKT